MIVTYLFDMKFIWSCGIDNLWSLARNHLSNFVQIWKNLWYLWSSPHLFRILHVLAKRILRNYFCVLSIHWVDMRTVLQLIFAVCIELLKNNNSHCNLLHIGCRHNTLMNIALKKLHNHNNKQVSFEYSWLMWIYYHSKLQVNNF